MRSLMSSSPIRNGRASSASAPASHVYNNALFAAYLARNGAEKTEAYLTALKANAARKPGGGDRDVARDILSGQCDIAIINTYYIGLMSEAKNEQKGWYDAIKPLKTTFANGGTHVNVSAAAIAKNAPNKAECRQADRIHARREGPEALCRRQFRVPGQSRRRRQRRVKLLGTVTPDTTPLSDVAKNRKAAADLDGQGRLRQLSLSLAAIPCPTVAIRMAAVDAFCLGALLGAGLVGTPILALGWTALSPQAAQIWPHLAANVIPPALLDTGLLLLGVGTLCAVIGVATAWLVTQYEFPGRRAFEWLLVLPLAIPTYITAYIYVELLGFQGRSRAPARPDRLALAARLLVSRPAQSPGRDRRHGARALPLRLSQHARAVRAAGAAIVEAARTLGASRQLFWRIGLPMARPALAAGLTLVLLETLNDIGATEYLGVAR
jgi:ABC-type glycerol-3-phosphate transport system permease component